MIVRAERRLRLCRLLRGTNRLPSRSLHDRVSRAAVVVCLVVFGSAQVERGHNSDPTPRSVRRRGPAGRCAEPRRGADRLHRGSGCDAIGLGRTRGRSGSANSGRARRSRTTLGSVVVGRRQAPACATAGRGRRAALELRCFGAPSIDLTPIRGVSARLERLSGELPGQALVALNDRDPRVHDLWKIDLVTAEKVLVMERTEFRTVHFDARYRPRVRGEVGTRRNPRAAAPRRRRQVGALANARHRSYEYRRAHRRRRPRRGRR